LLKKTQKNRPEDEKGKRRGVNPTGKPRGKYGCWGCGKTSKNRRGQTNKKRRKQQATGKGSKTEPSKKGEGRSQPCARPLGRQGRSLVKRESEKKERRNLITTPDAPGGCIRG